VTANKVPASARPPLDRKVSRETAKNVDKVLDEGLKLTIDGEVFEARYGDITPALARELRENSGMSFIRLVNTATVEADIDVLSAAVWVARRIRGEDVAFADVKVSYTQMLSDDFDISLPGAEDLGEAIDPEE
jgi:hypothetical protein